MIYLQDLLNEAIDKTKEIMEEKNPDLDNMDEVAEQVGVGAVVFHDLFNNRIKNVTFSWDQVLNFDGETVLMYNIHLPGHRAYCVRRDLIRLWIRKLIFRR